MSSQQLNQNLAEDDTLTNPRMEEEETELEAEQGNSAIALEEESVRPESLLKPKDPAKALDALVQSYMDSNPYSHMDGISHELEVKFGTKGIRHLTKNDFDNVVKLLKSFAFTTDDDQGLFSLRVYCEYLDRRTGQFQMSKRVRTEINGLDMIEKYCRSGDKLATVMTTAKFLSKKPESLPAEFPEFNFRVSLQAEQDAPMGVRNDLKRIWTKTNKVFRYLNRVTFTHPDYPVNVDMSIVKTGKKGPNGQIIPARTSQDANVFNNPESYDIEIEVDNTRVGPGTPFSRAQDVVAALRKVIKYVLSGLQGTMYPVSYPEQDKVKQEYMIMIWGQEYKPGNAVTSQHFLGPNSVTLQRTNIAPLDENSTIPNIRQQFVVTDKADGDRHLLFVASNGHIYLINTSMDIKFTGTKTTKKQCFHCLLDGELISHDRNGKRINLFAAFDVYFHNSKDVRALPFVVDAKAEKKPAPSRYAILKQIQEDLNIMSVIPLQPKCVPLSKAECAQWKASFSNTYKRPYWFNSVTMESRWDDPSVVLAPPTMPLLFHVKSFYPLTSNESIFDGCQIILNKQEQGLFDYETDGLIFTHTSYGVGSREVGKAGPKTKITWEHSFKWKPPQFNTIDFLVTTVKTPTGMDVVKPVYEDGMDTKAYVQFSEYKPIELRCGFSERNDGFLNPCQDIIDGKMYTTDHRTTGRNDYLPVRFYPTEPYDANAGVAKIMLREDASGAKKMFTLNNEVFGDNTIVEFAYDLNEREGWRWIPLRVRYDKTGKLMRGEKEFGNSYKVCNENWKSIHPSGRITEHMLKTGTDIPPILVSDDVYYNTPSGKLYTEALKNFHNLYVKKILITGASRPGDTLIDLACGKGGDLPKWVAARLSFVFGIDVSSDNLENRVDGACVRYLKMHKTNKHIPDALFVHGNSALNIRDGTALRSDKAMQITKAVFGHGPKDTLGKGVAKQYGKGERGFDVCSCQFAVHYFFKDPTTLLGFLRNVAECTKENGYFIGTTYDGDLLFKKLRNKAKGDSIQLNEPAGKEGKKIWAVTKGYDDTTFEDNSSSIGYAIAVYQESINQDIDEYLVSFGYLQRLMDTFGFRLIERNEANEMGLPEASGLFQELYLQMMKDLQSKHSATNLFGDAPSMSASEKEISFLNRYFVFQKVRTVDIDKLEVDLEQYNEKMTRQRQETMSSASSSSLEQEERPRPRPSTESSSFEKPKTKRTKKVTTPPQATATATPDVVIVEEIVPQESKAKRGRRLGKKMLLVAASGNEPESSLKTKKARNEDMVMVDANEDMVVVDANEDMVEVDMNVEDMDTD